MRTRVITSIIFLLLITSCSVSSELKEETPLPSIDAILFDGSSVSSKHDKLIIMTIAGIVNREKPRLYLQNVYETWSYSMTDETWLQYYKREGGVQFSKTISNVKELVNHFKSDIKGAIIYDPNTTASNFSGQIFYWQGEFASMLGGLTDCIPFPSTYIKTEFEITFPSHIELVDYFNGMPKKMISSDLTAAEHLWNSSSSIEPMARYLSLLNWGINEILPYTNPSCFYIREITDWTIQQRMFQVNLAGTDELSFESLPNDKALIIEKLMTFMKQKRPGKIFHVYGWMRPEPLIQWISAWGGSFHETLMCNLSWHHIFPVNKAYDFKRASLLNPQNVKLEDKVYVLIIGSEGDAGNWHIGLQSGAWLSSSRGDLPVAWGFNLHMFEMFPFIAQQYSKMATANDGFIAVTAPLGYSYSDMYEADVVADAIAVSKELMKKFNVNTFYAYKHYNGKGVSLYRGKTINNSYDFSKLGSFNRELNAQLCMLMDPKLGSQSIITHFGGLMFNHVNDGTFYGEASVEGKLSARIINLAKSKAKPSFLIGGYQRFRMDDFAKRISPGSSDISIARLKREMELVKADPTVGKNIEFVTPEKFTILIRKSLGM